MTLMYDTINEMLAPRHIIIHEMVAKWSHLEGTGHRHTIFFIIGSQSYVRETTVAKSLFYPFTYF